MFLKKLLLIHTGGTISMIEDKETGEVNVVSKHPLANISHQTTTSLKLDERFLFDLPSPQITPKHMLTLAAEIENELDNYDAFVITHGTDTLEETAFFLDLVLDTDKPVILTGAMRSSNEVGSDALYNLLCSIRVATNKEAKNKGVLVVMNDEIHSAESVTKTSTSNIASFQSPQFGPIGVIMKNKILFHRTRITRVIKKVTSINNNVFLLKAYAGMDEKLLNAVHSSKPDGLVIEAFGQGNLPKEVVPSIEAMIQDQIPIIIVSRSFNGNVQPTYGYEGGARHLESLGVILAEGLSGPKARIKLLIALEETKDLVELKKFF